MRFLLLRVYRRRYTIIMQIFICLRLPHLIVSPLLEQLNKTSPFYPTSSSNLQAIIHLLKRHLIPKFGSPSFFWGVSDPTSLLSRGSKTPLFSQVTKNFSLWHSGSGWPSIIKNPLSCPGASVL